MIRMITIAVLFFIGTAPARAADWGIAGAPVDIAKRGDYDALFSTLSAAGITVFFPTFQYRELPKPLSVGREVDFMPPCKNDAPGFKALRRHGMRLLVPAELIYPRGTAFPSAGDDPLVALIACAGRDHIYGVLTYDEPASSGVDEATLAALYAHIKAVDASIPVLMVHAPLVMDLPEFADAAGRDAYLARVAGLSRHADMVGFDVYPVTRDLAKIGTPYSNGVLAADAQAVGDYMKWLRTAVPDRTPFMVMQGFSYADQFEPRYLRLIAPPETIAAARAPDAAELTAMARAAKDGGAALMLWWGPSFIDSAASPLWRDILSTPAALSR